MTRRNDKRNNRRNRQRNNQPELSPFAQMLFGAILGNGAEMIANKMKEKDENTPSIHTEGITDKDIQNINEGNASLSKLRIPADGSAVEYPIPDNLQFFFDEEGKLMVRQKIEGDENPTDAEEGKPITYDDICKKLFLDMIPYKKSVKCTTPEQVKCMTAFNKLQNIAKYLNGDWMPDFDGYNKNWFIRIENGKYVARFFKWFNNGSVYFKSEEAANRAILLMGENSLNDLFTTDW